MSTGADLTLNPESKHMIFGVSCLIGLSEGSHLMQNTLLSLAFLLGH